MSLTQSNIPSVVDATLQWDTGNDGTFGATQDLTVGVTSVNVAGGGFQTSDAMPMNGDSFTFVGANQPRDINIETIFTDGETSDIWDTMDGRVGQTCYFRWSPKGGASGTKIFTFTGKCVDVPPPSLPNNGVVMFTARFRGTVADSTVA